jgi:queuine tRNA-ribosyltransferase
MSFSEKEKSQKSGARVGELITNHGVVATPFFMPIATAGAVKTIGTEDVAAMGAQIILSNTYHMMLRPGEEIVREAGGLHGFMNWDGAILTDSGGYQVFSLGNMRKLTEEGVTFNSHFDGSKHLLTPEKSMEVQHALGSDIVMVLDECPDYPITEQAARTSLELTKRWARRSKEHYKKIGGKGLLFGIQQGSTFPELRKQSTKDLLEIGFDGYAVGGLSFEEPRKESYALTEEFCKMIPADKPRYFMGGAKPHEIVEYVRRGIDMFDCVLPTRNARHGQLYRFINRNKLSANSHELADSHAEGFYKTMQIGNEQFKTDFTPIDEQCGCLTCGRYTRAYIRHLFSVKEPLGQRLATLHNVYFYLELMRLIRDKISADKL